MPTRREPQTRDELIAFAFEEIRNLKRRLAALSGSARTGDHGGLAGLGDDDHPQYETAAEVAGQVASHAALPDVHHATVHTEAEHTSAIRVSDEGVDQGPVRVIDFTGSGITVAVAGGTATVTHAGGGGGGGHVIQEDGVDLSGRTNLNFRNGLLASDGGAGPDSTIVDADYATSEIVDVADTESAGVSGKLPRADHAHKMGILTTKGDLLAYSTLPARLPVGADTQVLTADSTQPLGIKWAAAAAGGDRYATHAKWNE